jgi:hypothetical protein
MKTINEYKNRFNQLMESTMGDVKPLIMEQSTGETLPVVTKVYIEKYGKPDSGRCFQNPKLNNSCDSGNSFIEFNDGTILKYPNISYSSYVENGTYEGDEIKSLKPPYYVSFNLNNKNYVMNKY